MTDRTHTAARAAAFAGRLMARWQALPGRWSALDMTLRRIERAPALTIVQRIAPVVVSHHHAGPEVRIQLALGGGAGRDRSPAARPGEGRAPLPGRGARAVVVDRIARLAERAAPVLAAAPPRSPIALRPVTLPAAELAPVRSGRPGPVAPVTVVRRDEHERVETVVRRTRTETAGPVASPASASASSSSSSAGQPSGDDALAGPAPRRSSSPRAAQPVALAEVEITRLADRVVERIQRRVTVQRERMGGR